MAYSRKRTGRRTYSPSRSRSTRTTYRKGSTRKRAARAPQVMKLVVEVAPQNPVSRPDIAGLSLVEKPKGKAKL